LRRTLTWDQDNELFHHERIEQATGLGIYFADPHSPWQRGSNENTNGLLRQYFPMGTDLDLVSEQRLQEVADELNDRPRARLNDRSPTTTHGTMAPSKTHKLIRNDQWKQPATRTAECTEWRKTEMHVDVVELADGSTTPAPSTCRGSSLTDGAEVTLIDCRRSSTATPTRPAPPWSGCADCPPM